MPRHQSSKTPAPLSLTVRVVGDHLVFETLQGVPALTPKWAVFYALLMLAQGQGLTLDEICDHHLWSKQLPASAGREIWRFCNEQEARFFGERISTSPPRQTTKVFALRPDLAAHVTFEPSQEAVTDFVQNLRSYRGSQAVTLSNLTLLMQSGHVEEALQKLQQLKEQPLSLNELAQTEAMIATALDRLYGFYGVAKQVERLKELYAQPGLSKTNKARLLVRLARYYTLSGQYVEAEFYYNKLRRLLTPDDGLEFTQYHINYGLYLRRQGDLERAIHHTLIANESAHIVEWWYGVQATQSNLALMYATLGAQKEGEARRMYLEKARDWAIKGRDTTAITTQGEDEADIPLLLGHIHRLLGEYAKARRYLQGAIASASNIPSYQDWWESLEELALLEEELGNHQAAADLRAKAVTIKARQKGK